LYPIYHAADEIFAIPPLRVDPRALPVHFWDPMLSRQNNSGTFALQSAAMPFARGMMITTIMTMTTRKRGAFG
jgi:hypothetical protein